MGAASGRVDALVFMVGLMAGVWAFAEAWIALEGFVTSGAMTSATFAELLDVPFWALALGLGALAVMTAWILKKVEGRR